MATAPAVDLSRSCAERGSRYVDYLEQFVRMRKAGPERAALDAAGGGGSARRAAAGATGGGRYGSGSSGGGFGIATATVARPPDARERPRRALARYYPERSWAGAAPWSWSEEGGGGGFGGGGAWKAPSSSSISALTGAGALLLPLPAEAACPRRPNSAPLPPGGMLLWGGGGDGFDLASSSTPRRAKHRPTTTPDESGAAARALLRREPPAPGADGAPMGSWECWPATLRALPAGAPPHDSIVRHRSSSGDPWDRRPPGPAALCVDRAPSPCTTARPDRAAAREAYDGAVSDYLANKRRAALGAPAAARRYARPGWGAAVAATAFSSSSEAPPPLLPARVRGPTGAGRPASPEGSRWAAGAAATAAAAAAATKRGAGAGADGGGERAASFFEGE